MGPRLCEQFVKTVGIHDSLLHGCFWRNNVLKDPSMILGLTGECELTKENEDYFNQSDKIGAVGQPDCYDLRREAR